ncbi:MAG: LMWPc domain-containing protein [Succiniclasticum sp.]|jgi:protein-tyrosine phosphatase
MIKILFICHGNICRSPMAEFVLKDLVRREGREAEFQIASAATTTDDIFAGIGSLVYPPVRDLLVRHGMNPAGKRARLLKKRDYAAYDFLVGMDEENRADIRRICGGDPDHKISLLLDFTDHPREVVDPWYTRDFERTYRDILEGCTALLSHLQLTQGQGEGEP